MGQWEIVARPLIEPVRRMLEQASLPSSDIDNELLAHFFAARRQGELLGVVGLEPCGADGLLRSLVVNAPARRSPQFSMLCPTTASFMCKPL